MTILSFLLQAKISWLWLLYDDGDKGQIFFSLSTSMNSCKVDLTGTNVVQSIASSYSCLYIIISSISKSLILKKTLHAYTWKFGFHMK